jgi:hypothetical protein
MLSIAHRCFLPCSTCGAGAYYHMSPVPPLFPRSSPTPHVPVFIEYSYVPVFPSPTAWLPLYLLSSVEATVTCPPPDIRHHYCNCNPSAKSACSRSSSSADIFYYVPVSVTTHPTPTCSLVITANAASIASTRPSPAALALATTTCPAPPPMSLPSFLRSSPTFWFSSLLLSALHLPNYFAPAFARCQCCWGYNLVFSIASIESCVCIVRIACVVCLLRVL